MSRDYNGKFRKSKDGGTDTKEKTRFGFGFGTVMTVLLAVTQMWFPFLPLAALGFIRGFLNKNRNDTLDHCREYGNLMGRREWISVSELSETFDRPKEKIRKELKSKAAKEYFGSDAYLDAGRDCLYCPLPTKETGGTKWADVAMEVLRTLRGDPDVKRKPEPAPKAQKTAASAEKPAPENRNGAEKRAETNQNKVASDSKKDYAEALERILNELYDLNEKIQDEAVSKRIDRIGVLTASIFRVVIEKPERENDVRKFMNYYLPTTLKLLKAYSLMESQGYQGENIRESRKKIEETLDMLIDAFENLHDRLFRNDALDIAADIDVLKTMMAGDGLSGSGRLRI